MLDEPWLQFKTNSVRELAFAIASPPLLKTWPEHPLYAAVDLPDRHFWLTHFKNYLPRLYQLDDNASALEHYLSQLRSTRLGIRFEGLLGFWLQDNNAYHPYQLIGQSLKRMDGSRTLGELDFLILNQQSNQVEHWEVAIKFYLGEQSFMAEHWLGLNRRDSLGRKIKHLCEHQFNVQQFGPYRIEKQRAIIKGRLFYPVHQQLKEAPWLSPQHLSGYWGHTPPLTPSKEFWRRATRLEWLCEHASMPINGKSPYYWTDGLHFLIDENMVKQRYMLRANNYIHKYI